MERTDLEVREKERVREVFLVSKPFCRCIAFSSISQKNMYLIIICVQNMSNEEKVKNSNTFDERFSFS